MNEDEWVMQEYICPECHRTFLAYTWQNCPCWKHKTNTRHNFGEVKMTRLIQVIETEERRGMGTEEEPFRLVIQYWSTDGMLLCENDPHRKADDSGVE